MTDMDVFVKTVFIMFVVIPWIIIIFFGARMFIKRIKKYIKDHKKEQQTVSMIYENGKKLAITMPECKPPRESRPLAPLVITADDGYKVVFKPAKDDPKGLFVEFLMPQGGQWLWLEFEPVAVEKIQKYLQELGK